MTTTTEAAIDLVLRYLSDRPIEKLPALFKLAETLDRGHLHQETIEKVKGALLDEHSHWRDFVANAFAEVDPQVLRKGIINFFVRGNLQAKGRQRELEAKLDINIPWTLLIDPTSACNLHCTGCWAAEYGGRHNLFYADLSSLVRQGKELGIHFYIFSGGEPLVRADDLIRLCAEHQDCEFFAFTNGTLVDDRLCEDLLRVGNLVLAFSIEGDEQATNMRRGAGTYRRVVEAMERMKRHRLLFGYSTCYHRYNTESVGSDEFVDDMIARGCRFAWNFTYIPVGRHAAADWLATAEQREYMYWRVQEIRRTKPLFALDFWNDGEFAQGCVAGGRYFVHINAAGDVEPCAFVHYANLNIHEVTLLEALRSPLFLAYRRRQPFNDNHLRPCPLLDNPDALVAMVKESGARSTDMEAPEYVEDLCAKTAQAAERWGPVADRLWAESHRQAAAGGKQARPE